MCIRDRVESCLYGDHGVSLTLEGEPTVELFSESPARAVVSLPAASYGRFVELCHDNDVPVNRVGEVVATDKIEIQGLCTVDLDEVREAWAATIPAAMEH